MFQKFESRLKKLVYKKKWFEAAIFYYKKSMVVTRQIDEKVAQFKKIQISRQNLNTELTSILIYR